MPLLGKFEIQEREAEISTIIGLPERADITLYFDRIVWKNIITFSKTFKRNTGEFCYEEHMFPSSTHDRNRQ